MAPGPDMLSLNERLRGWERPSNWYLTGFPDSGGQRHPRNAADSDEDDDLGEVPETEGLAEESNEERKAAKKAFFPILHGVSASSCLKASKTLIGDRSMG